MAQDNAELVDVDTIVWLGDEEPDGSRRGVLIAAGDPVPAELAELPRESRG